MMTKGQSQPGDFDIQGHRGCRGLYPENSIPAFMHALELGVTTLEFDVVISADNQVIISHEPFMSDEICLMPDGSNIKDEMGPRANIYKLSYDRIKKYDCGSKTNENFPDQKKMRVHKPSLDDLVQTIRKELGVEAAGKVRYNIEIKRKAKWDNSHHPPYREFADIVMEKIDELDIADRTTIQCFDIPTLQYIYFKYPDAKLVYLVYNRNGIRRNISRLGFTPYVYSPYHALVNSKVVEYCKQNEMLLIPWTVNEKKTMTRLIDLGVDGIITDYPDRLLQLVCGPH